MESTLLRIYMPISAKVKGKLTLWQKIFHSSLAGYFLKQAKASGIEQAVYQRMMAGYLKGKKLVFDQVEVVPDDLPHCVELIDTEANLRSFITKNRAQFDDCRVVLFKTAQLIG